MNSMNDERFFDLAMKVIARQATDAECAELDARLSREPELRAEFARLQADARVSKEALPLVAATRATAGELPAYARGRLQTKVRQTLGRPEPAGKEPDRRLAWGWRWMLGLTAATAVVVIVLPVFRPPTAPVIQLAMLDLAGETRGWETNEVALLQQIWAKAKLDSFAKPELLRAWETNWPSKADAVIIIYDRNAGEVRVLGRGAGKSFQNSFPVVAAREGLPRDRDLVELAHALGERRLVPGLEAESLGEPLGARAGDEHVVGLLHDPARERDG